MGVGDPGTLHHTCFLGRDLEKATRDLPDQPETTLDR
jgi:hypothetical protein